MNPGDYVDFCELCKALYKKFEKIQGRNEGLILFSHQLINDLSQLQKLTQILLSKEEIKKIYILEVEFVKISKSISELLESILHKRLKKSKFFDLLNLNRFEYRIMYEIFKDKFY